MFSRTKTTQLDCHNERQSVLVLHRIISSPNFSEKFIRAELLRDVVNSARAQTCTENYDVKRAGQFGEIFCGQIVLYSTTRTTSLLKPGVPSSPAGSQRRELSPLRTDDQHSNDAAASCYPKYHCTDCSAKRKCWRPSSYPKRRSVQQFISHSSASTTLHCTRSCLNRQTIATARGEGGRGGTLCLNKGRAHARTIC